MRHEKFSGSEPGRRVPGEAERLHALLDGLALHAAMRPEQMSPPPIVTVLVGHLDSLDVPARSPSR